MPTISHKELLAMLRRFASHKEYAALKKSSEKAATEWRWATSLILPELPHDAAVRGFKPAKWVKKEPRYGVLHGLDSTGRICCMRGGERTKPDNEVFEQFLIHEDNGFWVIYYDRSDTKSLLAVNWYEFKDSRWLRSLECGNYGVRENVLHWEGDRLVKHVQRSWSGVASSQPRSAKVEMLKEEGITSSAYAYEVDGELVSVTETMETGDGDPPHVEVKYQRTPRGVNLHSLLQDAEALLVAEIPRTVKAATVPEPVYALMMQYTGVNTDPGGHAPPLFLPAESLRRRLAEEHPKDTTWYPWQVPEWESDPSVIRLNCQNTALDEKLQQIFQLTIVQASPSNYTPVRKMFQRVCARLNALDWKGILKTTDDFIAIPFDPHEEMEFKADLKACVPAEKLQLLIEHGWIKRMKVR